MANIYLPNLFLEISNNSLKFLIGKYDEDLNFNKIKNFTIATPYIKNGKIDNMKNVQKLVEKTLVELEDELNFNFKDINLVLENSDFECINLCGFKKLSGSQFSKQDTNYVINILKNLISENTKNSIIHIFNSEFKIDNKILNNLTFNLSGEFYTHELTFVLLKNIELQKIKLLFNNCNLTIDRIMFKSFLKGVNISENNKKETFVSIVINKNNTKLVFFKNSSCTFFQSFNFGSEIIISDIEKVCSLKKNNIINILSDISFNNYNDETNKQDYLDKKYFKDEVFRKISKSLLYNVINSRVEEIVDIIFNNNVDLEHYKIFNKQIFLSIEENYIYRSFTKLFEKSFDNNFQIDTQLENDNDLYLPCINAANIAVKGWKKEVLPMVEIKKSLISRIFASIFN